MNDIHSYSNSSGWHSAKFNKWQLESINFLHVNTLKFRKKYLYKDLGPAMGVLSAA